MIPLCVMVLSSLLIKDLLAQYFRAAISVPLRQKACLGAKKGGQKDGEEEVHTNEEG